MTIHLKKEAYDKMIFHAFAQLPEEACGLIGGRIEGGEKYIENVYFLTNIGHSREHYSLNAKEQLSAVRDMRKNGWEPLGNWHSHPESPSRPSQEDIRLAFDSSASYLILSLENQTAPVLNSFHVEKDEVEKENLVLE